MPASPLPADGGPGRSPADDVRPSPARILARRDLECKRSGLTLGETFPEGSTGWVGAARDAAGGDLVLKVAWAHEEARDEALGLRIWSDASTAPPPAAGADPEASAEPDPISTLSPMVPRVLAAQRDGDISVLLMERVRPGTTLAESALTPQQEDEVIAALLRRLWIPAAELPGSPSADHGGTPSADHGGTSSADSPRPSACGLRPLAHMCAWWADEAAQRLAADPCGLPADVIARGLDLFRTLPAEHVGTPVLLATDLHHHNVLAAREVPSPRVEDWRVIDAKPYVGDPHYDVLQHMFNDDERLREDPLGFAGRMAALTGLDAQRTARWLLARCVQEARPESAASEAALRLAALGI